MMIVLSTELTGKRNDFPGLTRYYVVEYIILNDLYTTNSSDNIYRVQVSPSLLPSKTKYHV